MFTQGNMKTQPQAWHASVLTACGFLPPVTVFRGQERKRSCDTSRSESEAVAELREESKTHPRLGFSPHAASRALLGY